MNDRACCGLACATFIVGTVALESGARYHLTTSTTMNHLSSMHCHPLSSIEPLLLPLLRIIVYPLSKITQNNAHYVVNMFCMGLSRYFHPLVLISPRVSQWRPVLGDGITFLLHSFSEERVEYSCVSATGCTTGGPASSSSWTTCTAGSRSPTTTSLR